MAYERRDSRGDFKGASHKQLISGTFTSHGNDPQLCNDEVRSGYVSRDRYTDQGRSESGSVQLYEQRSQSNYPTYGISNARDDNFSKGSDIPRYSREVEYEADGDPQAYRRGSITSIGNSENKAAKKIKQAEYAQYLVNQIQAREQKDGESRVGHSAPRKTSYDNRSDAGYPTTEETFDRNSSLTDKEGRYGTDLQLYQPSNDQDRYKSSTADKLYGGQEGIERLQHYSREQVFENGMSRQQRQSHQSQFRGRIVQDEELLQHQKVTQSSASSYNSPGHNPLGSGRFVEADVTDARPQDNVRGTGPTLSTAADYRREEIASKRAKQAEYAQSLHNQQQYRKQQEQQHHLSKANFLSTDIHDNSSYRNNPYNQNRRTDEAMSEKELKRAKQLEYAQALELQRMQQQQSPSSSSSAGSRSRRNSSPLSSKYSSTRDSIPFNLEDPVIASHRDRDRDKDRDRGGRLTGHDRTGRLEEGWTIGPIGQPVRKTLEVGHRGVQKAFNQSLNHCEAYGTQREERGGGGVEDNLSDLMNGRLKPLESGTPVGYDQYSQTRAQQQEQENPYTDNGNFSPSTQYRLMDDARGGGGGGLRDTLGSPKAHTFEPRTALDADVLDERKLKAKVMQSEQARALQQQMKDKAARAAAEKVKVEMDDLRESTRLEMERISMIKAYERDQQADKKNAVDENKSALLYQAEEKKGRKEIEERNELERERIDEMKMQDEREMVRRRELDEVERERNPRLRSPVVRTEEERMKYDKVSRAEEAFHAQSQARDSEMIESYTDMKRHPAGYSTRPTQSPFLLRQRDDLYDSNSPREKSKEKEVFEKSMRGTSRTESPGANTWNTDGRYDESEFDTSYRDISRDKEGRRVDRNRDSNSSNSHSNSDRSSYFPQDKRIGNERERRREKEMNESIVYPHQSSSSDAYNSRYVPTSTTWDRDKDRDRDNNRDRDRQRDKERERERERDRDYRGDDRSGEGGRGSQGRSHAPSRSTSSNYGNMKDEEVSKLDQTLVSDR